VYRRPGKKKPPLFSGGCVNQLRTTAVRTPLCGLDCSAAFLDCSFPGRAAGAVVGPADLLIAVDEHVVGDVAIGAKFRPGAAATVQFVGGVDIVRNEVAFDTCEIVARASIRGIPDVKETVAAIRLSKTID
jgi:hypothetical protein